MKRVAVLIVVLAGLLLIARAAWSTWELLPVPELLAIQNPMGGIVIHRTDPELHITVNGKILPKSPPTLSLPFRAGGNLVKVFKGKMFKGSVQTAEEFMDLKPGMMIELYIRDDGRIEHGYDGPRHAPPPRPGQIRAGTP